MLANHLCMRLNFDGARKGCIRREVFYNLVEKFKGQCDEYHYQNVGQYNAIHNFFFKDDSATFVETKGNPNNESEFFIQWNAYIPRKNKDKKLEQVKSAN